jgi:hypothetical protein
LFSDPLLEAISRRHPSRPRNAEDLRGAVRVVRGAARFLARSSFVVLQSSRQPS